jgi:two-component system phosphate regulon sensor histidine kinase PhoR
MEDVAFVRKLKRNQLVMLKAHAVTSAERYRSEFVGNVSHELRTPATSIAGYAETLLEDRDTMDPYVVEMVDVIHRNARRLTALFDDLLHLTRLEAREGPLEIGPIRLAPVVAEAMDKVVVEATEKEIHFEVVVSRDVHIQANREALAHVVQNLVSNAVKYSYKGGMVTVRVVPRDGRLRFEVIDVGIGIDPALHERIFERFYRVDKGRARAAGGTGLGLAIVKRLVDMMGAEIEVRSRPGRGSVFRVTFEPGVPED